MIRKLNVLAVLATAVVGMGSAALAQDPRPEVTPKAENSVGEAQIRDLIAKLGAEEDAARKGAERSLIEIGDAARRLLAEAVEEHDDPEVRWRARRVLRTLDGEQPPLAQDHGQARIEEVLRRLERAFGEDFGRLQGLEDMQRQLDEMRRQFDQTDRRAGRGLPGIRMWRAPGSAYQGVQIQVGPDGVKVEVEEAGEDGETTSRTYEAEDMESFREEYPEIAQRYFGGGGFGFFNWGTDRFEDSDGDGLPDARLPGLRPIVPGFLDTDRDGLPDRRMPGFQPIPLEVFPGPAAPPAEGERLGVYLGDLAPAVRDFLGIQAGQGLLVESIEDGSLANALGIRARDVVVKIGDRSIGSPADVRIALAGIDQGGEVVVQVNRMGETVTLKADKLHAAPGEAGQLRKREAPAGGR